MESIGKKRCLVPYCRNTEATTPNKIFFRVPRSEDRRRKWFTAMDRKHLIRASKLSTAYYCCEDHFNLEEDMEHYIHYKIMPDQHKIFKIKPNVTPHLFKQYKGNLNKQYVVPPSSYKERESENYKDQLTTILPTRRCMYINCTTVFDWDKMTSKQIKLYLVSYDNFPRLEIWLRNCGFAENVIKNANNNNVPIYICEIHFNDAQFVDSTHRILKPNATPTHFAHRSFFYENLIRKRYEDGTISNCPKETNESSKFHLNQDHDKIEMEIKSTEQKMTIKSEVYIKEEITDKLDIVEKEKKRLKFETVLLDNSFEYNELLLFDENSINNIPFTDIKSEIESGPTQQKINGLDPLENNGLFLFLTKAGAYINTKQTEIPSIFIKPAFMVEQTNITTNKIKTSTVPIILNRKSLTNSSKAVIKDTYINLKNNG